MTASLTSLHQLLGAEAAAASSAVFVYDSTPTAAFGRDLLKGDGAEIWQMETRPGAGSALVGFVEAIAFSSKGAEATEVEDEDAATAVPSKRASRSKSINIKKARSSTTSTADKPVTILGSTSAFLAVVPSILSLPPANIRPTVVAHISAQGSSLSTDKDGSVSLEQIPDLSSLFEGVQALEAGDWSGAVVLSETAEEAAFAGTAAAKAVAGAGFDFINVFDGLTAGRELSALKPAAATPSGSSLVAILTSVVPFFSYAGSSSATQVLVLPASAYSASAKAALAALSASGADVGVVVVRVVKPWNAAAFLAVLPASTKTLHVFADESGASTGPFYEDVLTTLLSSPSLKVKVRALPIPSSSVPSVQAWASTILHLASGKATGEHALQSVLPESSKLAVFWSLDSTLGGSETVPLRLAQAFAASGVSPKLETTFDNFRQGGLQQSSLLLRAAGTIKTEYSLAALAQTSPPALLFLSSPAAVLKSYEAISPSTVGPSTRVVLAANWTEEELFEKLPVRARQTLAAVAKGTGNVFVVDADKLAKTHGVQVAQISELIFWSIYLPSTVGAKEVVSVLSANPSFAAWDHAKLVEINSAVRNSLIHVHVDESWASEPIDVDGAVVETPAALPARLVPTAASANPDRTFPDPVSGIIGPAKASWHQVAQRLIFPEAYALSTVVVEKMRPDLPETTYVVTVSETRRLTPSNYDRNVFHLEFDTAGTGLKYAVGEALGIHGWNDSEEVREFLAWYGLDPEAIVTIPSRADPTGRVEQRTVFQLFQQNLDIFGKPGKSFYETLSRYATDKREERALRFIACPDGHATFKKMSETDTVTYADLLRQFPSARPTVDDLVREIEEIKPRHYSIASSQNFVGDSVHLLIVTVEWNTPKGTILSFLFRVLLLTRLFSSQVPPGSGSARGTSPA